MRLDFFWEWSLAIFTFVMFLVFAYLHGKGVV